MIKIRNLASTGVVKDFLNFSGPVPDVPYYLNLLGKNVGRTIQSPIIVTPTPPELEPEPSDDPTLFTMSFQNTESSVSTGLHKFGVTFLSDQVPVGYSVRLRNSTGTIYPVRTINKVTHANGSLKFCHIITDLGTLESSQTLSNLEIFAQEVEVGSNPPIDPFVYFASQSNTITVDITNHSGSASGALSDRAYNLKTAIENSARCYIFNANDMYVDGMVWQQEPNGEHLTVQTYFNMWFDNQAVCAIQSSIMLTQHWIKNSPFGLGTNKERRDYDALIKWGDTVLNSYADLEHAYHTQWIGVRTDADAARAKPHWINISKSMPTIRTIYSTDAINNFYATGMLPPIDYNETFNAGTWQTSYTPLGVQDMSTNPNATGQHPERGIIPDPMARLLADQSAQRYYEARINAHAALAYPIHHRDARNTELGNVSNGLVPAPFSQLGSGTASYDNLADEIIFVKKTGSTLTFDTPNGGTGVATEPDEAHIGDYAGTTWILEGERYLFDAVLDMADFTMRRGNWNDLDHDTRLYFYAEGTARRANLNIPNTKYGHLPDFRAQPRNWVPNILGVAYATCPDDDRHKPYLDNVIANSAQFFDISLNGDGADYNGYPTTHKTFGVLYSSDSRASFWNSAFTSMSLYRLANAATGNNKTAFLEAAHQSAQQLVRIVELRKFMAFQTYRAGWLQNETSFEDYLPDDGSWTMHEVTIDASTDVLTLSADSQSGLTLETGYSLTNGDRAYFSTRHPEGSTNVPSEASLGTLYYIQNVSGDTFKLSTDVGGSNIVDFTSNYIDTDKVNLYIDVTEYSDIYATVGASSSAMPNADDYLPICEAAIDTAWINNHPNLSSAAYDEFKTWAAPISHLDYGSWATDGRLIRAIE